MTRRPRTGAALVVLAAAAVAPIALGAGGGRSSQVLDVRSFRPVEGPSSGPAVYYQVVEEPGGSTVLRGDYRPGLETVVMGAQIPEALRGRVRQLRWRWRVRAFPVGGDECGGSRGDSAASVLVTFKRGFRWYILKYVWSPVSPLGATCDRKRTLLLVRDTIILERAGPVGRWFNEVIDVRRAFIDHFENGNPRADVPDLVG